MTLRRATLAVLVAVTILAVAPAVIAWALHVVPWLAIPVAVGVLVGVANLELTGSDPLRGDSPRTHPARGRVEGPPVGGPNRTRRLPDAS